MTRLSSSTAWIPRRPMVSVSRLGLLLGALILVAAFARDTLAAEAPGQAAPTPKAGDAKSPTPETDGVKPVDAKAEPEGGEKKPKDPYAWRSMFDGKTLEGWKAPQFGGEGEVKVEDGAIVMEMGDPMTGIVWTGELPKIDYEFRMEAQRTMGIDFFATTTFPYGDDSLSLVVGGWAGAVVGLSCVDWYDASDNLTTKFMAFKDKQWYRIRIRVTKQRIEAWIDDEKMVDLATKGHKFSIRDEVDLCKPLGICTWCTTGKVRKLEIRSLKPEEVEEIPARDRWD